MGAAGCRTRIAREIEQRRLFPWIAVCFGLGILLFFQADGTPALWAPLAEPLACVCGRPCTAPEPACADRR